MKLRILRPRAVVWRIRSRARLLAVSAVGGALAITAATALAPGGPAAMADGTFNPAITVAGGNSVIAVHTSGNGLRFYWNEFGTNNWHGEQVAADGTTFSDPSIAQVGNTVVIAAEGIFDSLDVYWQTIGASGWNAETVAGIRTTYSAPSIAQNGNSAIIAAEGPSGSLDFYWAINGTATWHPEVVAGAGTTATTPAISAHDNGVTIVALNQGGYLSTSWWATNGTTDWIRSPMPDGDTGASSIAAYAGNVYVVARELFGYMGVSTSAGDSGWWTSTQVIWTELKDLVGVAGVPSVTVNDGMVNIAVEDGDGNLVFYWEDSSGNFHEETVDSAANL
jgi:hypothetical protein